MRAQLPDHVFRSNIHAIKLIRTGDPYSYPVINLNSSDELNLTFDDLDGDIKDYYFTYQLCNADWTPANISLYDYIRGFQNTRISTYRNSSIALTRYTNYQARVPDRSSTITRSGNYLLKVFLNSDTAQLVFTKRFLVVDNKAAIGAMIQQPFNSSLYYTHQKLRITVTTNSQVSAFNQQDIKVVALQNFIWQNAVIMNRPDIYRGNYFEYNDEAKTTFAAGKEWRWIDLRSLRLMSERMWKIDKQPKRTDVYVKPDVDRTKQAYLQYVDLNGMFTLETTDNLNPFWQSDYAYVHFTYQPPGGRALEGREVYIFGELTNYTPSEDARMTFNEERGIYEVTLLLKQGYYNYAYITRNLSDPGNDFSYENTEGNYWGTENAYTVMVYYRPFGGRADELIGFTTLNSISR
ncbi:MAG: DUF5103 domain-containing protein [Terrimonas sp.]|nr:DUF5103 domain-containing protein [Terrimonas sp.]